MKQSNFYKRVILYNQQGNPDTVYVFTGTEEQIRHEELFRDIELNKFKLENTKIIQVNALISQDDSIRNIKKKILHVMNQKNLALEEMYLFYRDVEKHIEPRQFYQQVTNKGKNKLFGRHFGQILMNCGFEEKNTQNVPYKNEYYYSDIVSFNITEINLYKPLGFVFSDFYDYNFSGNPFQVLQTEQVTFENYGNILMMVENELLLNFFQGNTLHLICAEPLLHYCNDNNLDSEYMLSLYYPLLKGVTNLDNLPSQRGKLIQKNKQFLKAPVFQHFDNLALLYNIDRTNEKGIEGGIQYMKLTLFSKHKIVLPLETIFKSVHCDKYIAAIKFNPGKKKENVFRIYTTQSTKTGERIPSISKSNILHVSKSTHRANTVTYFVFDSNFTLTFTLDKESNFNIEFMGNQPTSQKKVTSYIKKHYQNISENLNSILLQSGFHLPAFVSLEDPSVHIEDIHYGISFPNKEQFDFKKCNSLFSEIFKVVDKTNKNKINLNYTRVENYKQMEAIDKELYDNYKKHSNPQKMIDTLMENYQYDTKKAVTVVNEFFQNFIKIRGKNRNYKNHGISNPGFPTIMSFTPFESIVSFTFKHITSIFYIPYLELYIDSLRRILYEASSISIDQEIITKRCSMKIKDIEDTDAEIVITPDTGIPDIVPVTFVSESEPLEFNEEKAEPESGIFFDDDDEEGDEDEEGGEGDQAMEEGDDDFIFFDDDDDDDEMMGGANALDNTSLQRPNPFADRLQKREPQLIMTEKTGKFDTYSRLCPTSRIPIILTDEEKQAIDKDFPNSYSESMTYGTDPEKQYHYICPRYWCLLTNKSITQEEVDSGRCGKIIPQNSKSIPEGHYVYEFTSKSHIDGNGKFIQHTPGFLKSNKIPQGANVPCCFKKAVKKQADKQPPSHYIIGFDSFPIPDNRLAFLPPALTSLLQIDYSTVVDKKRPSLLTKNSVTILRNGCEISENKSFVGILAKIMKFAYNTPTDTTISQFCKHLVNYITIDDFIMYNNGSLVSQFKNASNKIKHPDLTKYQQSNLYKSVVADKENTSAHDFFNEAIIAFENFQKSLLDDNSKIDHTVLWDVVCHPRQRIFPEPYNLIIFEVNQQDVTNNVNILCPSSSYSSNIFDPARRTIMILKQDNYYELLTHVVIENKPTPTKYGSFSMKGKQAFPKMKEILKVILQNAKNRCMPLPSLPKEYRYIKNHDAETIVAKLLNKKYVIDSQVINYQGKVIALMVRRDEDEAKPFYLPTYPSSIIYDSEKLLPEKKLAVEEDAIRDKNNFLIGSAFENSYKYPVRTIDDELWHDYKYTKQHLRDLYDTDNTIYSKPILKALEGGLVVGIITQTNQFIPIVPPQQNIDDDLDTIHESNLLAADKELILKTNGNPERMQVTQDIVLESKFYNAFRNIVRNLLHDIQNIEFLEKVRFYIDETRYYYKHKIKKVFAIISQLIEEHVVFAEYDKNVLSRLEDIHTCFNNPNEKDYCILQDDTHKFQIPMNNLISGKSNQTTYLNRISDELVRNQDVSQFLMNDDNVLRIPESSYQVNDDEFILLQSLIQTQHFDNLQPFSTNTYSKLNVYNTAKPAITQYYSNAVTEKREVESTSDLDYSCISVNRIHYQITHKWKKHLPANTNEIEFKNDAACSFGVLQYLIKRNHNLDMSNDDIKNILVEQYNSYSNNYLVNIIRLLEDQGKKKLMKHVKQQKVTLEFVIKSDKYFISDLDILMIANKTRIPIVLYANDNMITIDNTPHKFIAIGGSNINDAFNFIYSENKHSSYRLVSEPMKFSQLIDFKGSTAISAMEDILVNVSI